MFPHHDNVTSLLAYPPFARISLLANLRMTRPFLIARNSLIASSWETPCRTLPLMAKISSPSKWKHMYWKQLARSQNWSQWHVMNLSKLHLVKIRNGGLVVGSSQFLTTALRMKMAQNDYLMYSWEITSSLKKCNSNSILVKIDSKK